MRLIRTLLAAAPGPLAPLRAARSLASDIWHACPSEAWEMLDLAGWKVVWGGWVMVFGREMMAQGPRSYGWMHALWPWGLLSVGLGLWSAWALLLCRCLAWRRAAVVAALLFDGANLVGSLLYHVVTPVTILWAREVVNTWRAHRHLTLRGQ